MAFSQYRHISKVQEEFQIIYREATFLKPKEIAPSAQFLKEFQFNNEYLDPFSSEAARSELVISPILREVYKPFATQYILWIQKSIFYTTQLSGTPDYMFATRSALGKTVLATPLLVAVEAKRNDFEVGWGQCAAELVAAQKLNENPSLPVYGIVTDGKIWEFGKLVKDIFTKNQETYTVDRLSLLFGAIDQIFRMVSQQDV